jgi:hypothetical protein
MGCGNLVRQRVGGFPMEMDLRGAGKAKIARVRLYVARSLLLLYGISSVVASSIVNSGATPDTAGGHPIRFVVLCAKRTGSTLLIRSLQQHPQLFAHGEVFHSVWPKYDPKARELFTDGNPAATRRQRVATTAPLHESEFNTEKNVLLQHMHHRHSDNYTAAVIADRHRARHHGATGRVGVRGGRDGEADSDSANDEARIMASGRRRKDPTAFLNTLWSTTGSAKAVGFKLLKEHLDWAVVSRTLLADLGVKKVVLFRRDIIAWLTSLEAAQRSGRWQSGPYRAKVNVSMSAAVKEVRAYLEWFAFIKAALQEQEYFLLNYEDDLVARFNAALSELSTWLGLDEGITYKMATTKQLTGPVEHTLQNFHAVRDALASNKMPVNVSYLELPAADGLHSSQKVRHAIPI